MKTECKINEMLGEFAKVVADDFGIFLKRCWEHVGGTAQDLHDFNCDLHRTAIEELIGDDYVSADRVADVLRTLSGHAKDIVSVAVHELKKLGTKP